MTKIVAIIGGVLLMAGVALAGTVSSLGSSGDQAIGSTLPAASISTTVRQDDRAREREVRGRETEAGEDLRGPCDEAEHANDPRCTGTAAAPATTTIRTDDDRRGSNRGPGGGRDDGSGHHGDDSGHSGHGGHGGDD
jgi:hypothetical protein